ncbi:MAG: hypothetical protein IIX51_02390 [Methanocorpusculum sp.]|jgi:hypothetical protein|nr:hypothetical protein [Methanocorpusculum sp.]
MNAALAYTPNLNKWVTSLLDEYTYIFDEAASDAIGFLENREPVDEEIQNDVDAIMEELRKDALKELNGE